MAAQGVVDNPELGHARCHSVEQRGSPIAGFIKSFRHESKDSGLIGDARSAGVVSKHMGNRCICTVVFGA
jgi:hypothetical protein